MKAQFKILLGIVLAILIIVSCEDNVVPPFADLSDACLTDPFQLGDVNRNGDSLFITVSYSGGCVEHDFVIFTELGDLKESPVKLKLTIQHNSNGDQCEAYITETLNYSLSKLLGTDVPQDLELIIEECKK